MMSHAGNAQTKHTMDTKTQDTQTAAQANGVGSGRFVGAGKSPSTIRRELRALRRFIDTTDDALAGRIAYAMETVLRWATEKTAGRNLLVAEAELQAECCRRMNEHTSAPSPNVPSEPRGSKL